MSELDPRPPQSVSSNAGSGDSEPQLAYLERLLGGVADPSTAGEFLYIVRIEGEPAFWELVGLRVSGLSRALVGAIRFQSQTKDPARLARRSLGNYLSSPPQSLALDRTTYPADLIEFRVPRHGETVPDLLGRLKRGEATGTVFVDADMVELAWDFRAENPSVERPRRAEGPGERMLMRSREGHVLSGRAANLSSKLRSERAFMVLTGVEQRLADRSLSLPTLVIHRAYLTMMTELPADESELPGPFTRDHLNPFHLLDPRLTTER